MATRFAFVDVPVLLVLFVSLLTAFHPVFADDDPSIVDNNSTDNVDSNVSVADQIKSDTDLKYNETGVEKVTYDGAQLFRIKGVDEELRNKLDELDDSGVIETWSARSTEYDIMVKGDKIDDVSNLLYSSNATFEVVIEDIQRAIIDENPVVGLSEDRQTPYNLTWQRYHRYSDHLQYFSYLAKHYSDVVSLIDVGNSVEGRPIKVLKISSGSENPKAMWIDGGTHAREWISPATVSYMVRELVERRSDHIDNAISKRIGSAISNIDFYIAPVLNPDGYEYSHTVDRLWRKNRKKNSYCIGTDLNRNWGYKWGGAGSSKHPCKEIYAGSSAFSEPETRAISNFVLSIKDKLKGFVTFHSYGQYILYPWGYASKVPPDYADLDRVGKKAAAAIQKAGGPAYKVGNSATTLYPASGGADDWAKGAAGIKYTYTFELRDDGRYGFVLPPHYIEPCGKESLAAIKVIAEEINNLA